MSARLANGVEVVSVHVRCVNWSAPAEVPRAVAYALGADGSAYCDLFGTWPQAIAHARRIVDALRRASALSAGVSIPGEEGA